MNEQEKAFRKSLLKYVVDSLNIGDDRILLGEAKKAVDAAPMGTDFLHSVFCYMEGIGCEAARERNKRQLTEQVETYIRQDEGDSDFTQMEPEKKRKFFLGFWHRREKEGD